MIKKSLCILFIFSYFYIFGFYKKFFLTFNNIILYNFILKLSAMLFICLKDNLICIQVVYKTFLLELYKFFFTKKKKYNRKLL